MSQRNALVTVIDVATVTSMPFNEFLLYRAKHREAEREILVSCHTIPRGLRKACGPNVEIYETDFNLVKLRSVFQSIKDDCESRGERYAIHMHSPRVAFFTLLSVIGTELWKKTLFTVHSTFSGYALHNKILSFLCALMAGRITCVSEASFQAYPSLVRNLKKDRIEAIPNGVNMERIDRAIFGSSVIKATDGTVRFAYIANMRPIKNHSFLLHVLEELPPNIQFMFIGGEEKSIRLEAKKMGIVNRIEFTGLLPREDVFRKMLDADVYISPSTLEGLPISVLEAMACGLPVILSDIPPHREIEKAAECISVLPLEKEAWIREIERYAGMSRDKRKRLGQLCKKHVKEYFSLEKMHHKYDKVYDALRDGI